MSKYTGIECPICNNQFKNTDDIVVCPVCGAPYHRNCYQQLGHCKFESEHAAGFEWKPAQTSSQEENETATPSIICSACGKENPEQNIFCDNCGARLAKETEHTQDTFFAQNVTSNMEDELKALGEEIDGVKMRDLAVFVGINQRYFLPRFVNLHKRASFFSINWSAFFLNFIYCFFRKMYVLGIAMFTILAGTLAPMIIWTFQYINGLPAEAFQNMSYASLYQTLAQAIPQWLVITTNIMSILLLVSSVLCGILFNRLYFKHSVKKVKEIEQMNLPPQEQANTLFRTGSVDLKVLIILAMVFLLLNLLSGSLFSRAA